MSCVTMVKAALARFLFGLHTLVTVWRVVSQEEDSYWKLAIGIIILFVEGLHALCYRKGQELPWFCPSVLIYLGSIIPAIWILELKTNRRELLCSYIKLVRDRAEGDEIRFNMLLDLMQMKQGDMEEANQMCQYFDDLHGFGTKEEGLKQIGDIHLNITLKPEQWTRILEQIVLVVLILGRWLLPKGKLSRNQFSQQMLVYIGMAADIVEIFEAFRESKVMLEPNLTYAILGVWSWSLLQFCLVQGSGHRGRKTRLGMADPSERPSCTGSVNVLGTDLTDEKKKQLKMDMIAILTAILLQDGPFFCLRMMLIFRFRVISHMNIFFTCKNTLVIMLQVYRLLVLCLERRPHYRRQSRLFSLIPHHWPNTNQTSEAEPKSTLKSTPKSDIQKCDVAKTKQLNEGDDSSKIGSKKQTSQSTPKLPKVILQPHKRAFTTSNSRQKPPKLKRRQMSAKQISTASEEVPFSTSDDSEHNPDPQLSPLDFAKYPQGGANSGEILKYPLGGINSNEFSKYPIGGSTPIIVKRQLDLGHRFGSNRSLASQLSTESAVLQAVKEKEEKWKRIHSQKQNVKQRLELQV